MISKPVSSSTRWNLIGEYDSVASNQWNTTHSLLVASWFVFSSSPSHSNEKERERRIRPTQSEAIALPASFATLFVKIEFMFDTKVERMEGGEERDKRERERNSYRLYPYWPLTHSFHSSIILIMIRASCSLLLLLVAAVYSTDYLVEKFEGKTI